MFMTLTPHSVFHPFLISSHKIFWRFLHHVFSASWLTILLRAVHVNGAADNRNVRSFSNCQLHFGFWHFLGDCEHLPDKAFRKSLPITITYQITLLTIWTEGFKSPRLFSMSPPQASFFCNGVSFNCRGRSALICTSHPFYQIFIIISWIPPNNH